MDGIHGGHSQGSIGTISIRVRTFDPVDFRVRQLCPWVGQSGKSNIPAPPRVLRDPDFMRIGVGLANWMTLNGALSHAASQPARRPVPVWTGRFTAKSANTLRGAPVASCACTLTLNGWAKSGYTLEWVANPSCKFASPCNTMY